jgi:hypothetical protein
MAGNPLRNVNSLKTKKTTPKISAGLNNGR